VLKEKRTNTLERPIAHVKAEVEGPAKKLGGINQGGSISALWGAQGRWFRKLWGVEEVGGLGIWHSGRGSFPLSSEVLSLRSRPGWKLLIGGGDRRKREIRQRIVYYSFSRGGLVLIVQNTNGGSRGSVEGTEGTFLAKEAKQRREERNAFFEVGARPVRAGGEVEGKLELLPSG